MDARGRMHIVHGEQYGERTEGERKKATGTSQIKAYACTKGTTTAETDEYKEEKMWREDRPKKRDQKKKARPSKQDEPLLFFPFACKSTGTTSTQLLDLSVTRFSRCCRSCTSVLKKNSCFPVTAPDRNVQLFPRPLPLAFAVSASHTAHNRNVNTLAPYSCPQRSRATAAACAALRSWW